MKIKQFLMAAAALMLAVSCGPVDEPEPQPEFTPETWSVVGTNNGWDAANAPAMAFENDYYVAQNVVFEEKGAFKFVKDNAWTVSRSYAGEKPIRAGYYYAVQQRDGEGTDIFVEKPGTYDIYLNKTADKFYMMADGAVPADAQDGETIEVAPAAVAEIAILESEMAENMIAFSLTTANVAAASYNVLPTEAVDETITAEYVLSEEGGFSIDAEYLGGTMETTFRRGVQAGTEYTIFLAYEDLNGVKAMVTETVTTPGAAAPSEIIISANSYMLMNDPEWNEGMFIFYGEEYELVVMLDTEIKADTDYSFADHITDVYFKDAASGDRIEDVEAGTFSIYNAEGVQCAFAEVVTASGATVIAEYVGEIPEVAAGGAGAGFEIAIAKFYHSSKDTMFETPVADTRYCLELTSTNQDFLFLVIDNYYPLEQFGETTPFLQGQFMPYNPEYPTEPCVNLELSFMMMYQIMNFQFLVVETGMGSGMDLNTIQVMFTAISHLDPSMTVQEFKINTPEPISMYTDNSGSWEDAPVLTFEFSSEGAGAVAPFMVEELNGGPGLAPNVYNNMNDIYFPIYDYSQGTETISYISSGFYPVVEGPGASGVLAGMQYYIAPNYEYYYIQMPESEADADGRPYGATVTTQMPEADHNVIELYVPAVSATGQKVYLDLKYEGMFGYSM